MRLIDLGLICVDNRGLSHRNGALSTGLRACHLTAGLLFSMSGNEGLNTSSTAICKQE